MLTAENFLFLYRYLGSKILILCRCLWCLGWKLYVYKNCYVTVCDIHWHFTRTAQSRNIWRNLKFLRSLHTHTFTLTRVHQNIIPHVFYCMVFVNLACEKFSELTYGTVESIVIFPLSTHPFWQLFFTFKERQYSLPAEVSSPLLAVTGTWRCAVPHNWCNAILAGFFFQGPYRWKPDAARSGLESGYGHTLHTKFVDCLCSVHARVCSSVVWRGNTWDIFLVAQTWQRQAFRLFVVSVSCLEVMPL